MESRLWRGFWQLADPKIWVASTVPMLVGGALAWGDTGQFSLYWFAVALIGVWAVEIAKNATNEVADREIDAAIAPDRRTPFSGGKKTLVQGLLTVRQAQVIAAATLAVAALIGLYVILRREPNVLWIAAFGGFFAVFYSLPPFRFNYRGLGEAVVGLTFGVLILAGIYLTLTHTLTWRVAVTGLPLAFLITNVLWINQFPDLEADAGGGKRNWVVRLGRRRAVRVFALLFSGAFLSASTLIVVHQNPIWIITLAALPQARAAVAVAREHYDDIPNLLPANAKTVLVYQITGLAMTIAALTNRYFQTSGR